MGCEVLAFKQKLFANKGQQQQKQQQQEEDQWQAEPHQQESAGHGESVLYSHGEHDQRSRPQSRASQHETHIMENGSGQHHGGGNYHVRAQHQKVSHAPQASSFPFQQSQFEDPERSADEMW